VVSGEWWGRLATRTGDLDIRKVMRKHAWCQTWRPAAKKRFLHGIPETGRTA
jgi:hypothetical protein